jgi:hypothetical protein
MNLKLKAYELHKLHFVAEFPHTLDLKEKAAQTIQLQNTIASIMSGLMANQVPLALNVSVSKGKPNLGVNPADTYNVTIYWRQIEDPEMHAFKDLMMAKRCLACADFMSPEGHVCNFQSPDQNDEDEELDEILQ